MGGRDEDTAHRHRDGRITQGEYSPDYSATPRVILHPPFLTPQRLPCEQVDELVKEAAVMIKCENESGKLDEVR